MAEREDPAKKNGGLITLAEEKKYHKYVFDAVARKFVGKFEEMYSNEDKESFDSWSQEDMLHITKVISLAVLGRYNFDLIFDIGCGKGAFTHMLKKANNAVIGADMSKTAIAKAQAKYKDIDFRVMTADQCLDSIDGKAGHVVMMEILSYIEDWKAVIKKAAKRSKYIYISLYIPPDPIGFVKSFDELTDELKKYFRIETELILNKECIYVMGEAL